MSDGLVGIEPAKNFVNYVNGFRRRLYIPVGMARENLKGYQIIQKYQYDHPDECHQFSLGDQVFLPLQVSPFQAKFAGPSTVKKQVLKLNYLISIPNRRKASQLCHLLKPYYAHDASVTSSSVVRPALIVDSVLSDLIVGEGGFGQ